MIVVFKWVHRSEVLVSETGTKSTLYQLSHTAASAVKIVLIREI